MIRQCLERWSIPLEKVAHRLTRASGWEKRARLTALYEGDVTDIDTRSGFDALRAASFVTVLKSSHRRWSGGATRGAECNERPRLKSTAMPFR